MNNVLKKVLDLRVKVHTTELKKSGKNKHIGFTYFELADFLPATVQACNELGLYPKFDVTQEKAILTVYDVETSEHLVFETTRAQASLVKATPVQELGAEHTYLKRYLYMHLLDLFENDIVDAESGAVDEAKITPKQIELIDKLFSAEQQVKLCDRANVKSIKELTVTQASEYIKQMQEHQKKKND